MYDFDLPNELVAQAPASPRDSARLLVYKLSNGEIVDSVFSNIDNFLDPRTTLAINNSKVDNCRWLFSNKIELFVLEKTDNNTIRAMVRPGKKFRAGSKLSLTDWLDVETLAVDEEGIRTIRLSVNHDDTRLKEYEHIPLPPYIKQNDSLASEYQTVYARPLGSLAAPTAGLHFTDSLLSEISKSHDIAEVTLHVGLGTFAKLNDDNLVTGRLHEELFLIDKDTSALLNRSKHITAVGTTSIRTLESAFEHGGFMEKAASTDIFIRPGYKFKSVDSLITNFHLPSTSLLMLVAAFIADKRGLDESQASKELLRIYDHAVSNKYRFYSFGDAMLIV